MILTYRYRVKNPGPLLSLARSVNSVWNYCGEVQDYMRRRCRRWPTAFDLIQLTRASRELGLHSDAIAAVCLQFVRSRYAIKRRPRWRISAGPRRSLSWVHPQGIAALGVREWVCVACGTLHDRDLNAAHNLLLRKWSWSGQRAVEQLGRFNGHLIAESF